MKQRNKIAFPVEKRCIMSIDIANDETRCGLGDRIKCSGLKEDRERCPFWISGMIEPGKLPEDEERKEGSENGK